MLVNNAGLALGLEPAQRASLDEWEEMIDTNCTGLVTVTRAVLPGMVERNRGHVVNLGSVAGSHPYPGGNVYGATKAFVHQFSLNLRADLLGTAMRVTVRRAGHGRDGVLARPLRAATRVAAKKVYEGVTPLSPRGRGRRDPVGGHAAAARERERRSSSCPCSRRSGRSR